MYRLRVIQATAIELCNCHQNKLKAIAQLTFTICCSCVGSTKSSRTSRVTCFLFVAFDMTQRVPFEQHALSCSPAILSHLRNNFRSSLCQERLEGQDYFTELSGTERNWGLKYGTEHIRNDRIGLGIGGLTTHGDSSTALAQLHCKLLRS